MKFNKIDLKEDDWFDRGDFTYEQLEMIKENYKYISEQTFTENSTTIVSLQYDGEYLALGYIYQEDEKDLRRQYKVSDFFPDDIETSTDSPEQGYDPRNLLSDTVLDIAYSKEGITVTPAVMDDQFMVQTHEELLMLCDLLSKVDSFKVV